MLIIHVYSIILVAAQASCSGTGSFASLEMSLVNILTALDLHQMALEHDTEKSNDKDFNDCSSAHGHSGIQKLLPQLISLSNCDAKNVALYKLQNCHIRK